MNEQTLTATQMVWQPPLLKLTRVPHPDLPGEHSTYVRADLIMTIQHTWIELETMADPKVKYPPVVCTYMAVQGGIYVHVLEPSDVVAHMRDKAILAGYSYLPIGIR